MSLTTTQLQALKADIATQVAGGSGTAIEGLDPLNPDDAYAIADWYNQDSSFWVWRSSASAGDVGNAINLVNVGSLTTAESSRLQVSFMMVNSNSGAFHPERSDHRGMFEDIFSGAQGAETRASLLSLWQRHATRIEALLATGTGTECTALNTDGSVSSGSPGTLSYEGSIQYQDVQASQNV